jgi:ubiquitin-protein ligase
MENKKNKRIFEEIKKFKNSENLKQIVSGGHDEKNSSQWKLIMKGPVN